MKSEQGLKVEGSVMVVGGGIAGMQSALGQDLSHQRLCHVNYLA